MKTWSRSPDYIALDSSYYAAAFVRASEVVILAIVHGARDLAALWKREGREETEE